MRCRREWSEYGHSKNDAGEVLHVHQHLKHNAKTLSRIERLGVFNQICQASEKREFAAVDIRAKSFLTKFCVTGFCGSRGSADRPWKSGSESSLEYVCRVKALRAYVSATSSVGATEMPTCWPLAMILKIWFTFYLSENRREPALKGTNSRQGKGKGWHWTSKLAKANWPECTQMAMPVKRCRAVAAAAPVGHLSRWVLGQARSGFLLGHEPDSRDGRQMAGPRAALGVFPLVDRLIGDTQQGAELRSRKAKPFSLCCKSFRAESLQGRGLCSRSSQPFGSGFGQILDQFF